MSAMEQETRLELGLFLLFRVKSEVMRLGALLIGGVSTYYY